MTSEHSWTIVFDMQELGKILIFSGLAMEFVGLLLWSGVGKTWLGRLPGDFHWSRGNFSFYFPLATCLVLSVILTLIVSFFRK